MKLSEAWSAEEAGKIIAEWPINQRDLLRITIRLFKGRTLVDVRRWYNDVGGNRCPGKGVALRPEDVPPLRKALRKVQRQLESSI